MTFPLARPLCGRTLRVLLSDGEEWDTVQGYQNAACGAPNPPIILYTFPPQGDLGDTQIISSRAANVSPKSREREETLAARRFLIGPLV